LFAALSRTQGYPPVGYRSEFSRSRSGRPFEQGEEQSHQQKETPPERSPGDKRPRIGVFVCHCGINISGVVDVPAVRDYAASLPYVEYATDNLFTCSTDTQDIIAKVIQEKNLNRIVVAACTPKTHEPLFQETLVNAGLNKYLFEMTNIRNQDSWVHKDEPKKATEKAMDLVRMAVAKAALMTPLKEADVDIKQRALVVGGGISGMVSARTLSRQGYKVSLVEEGFLAGRAGPESLSHLEGRRHPKNLSELVQSVETDANIDVHLNTELTNVEGFVGNFKTTLSKGAQVVEHG